MPDITLSTASYAAAMGQTDLFDQYYAVSSDECMSGGDANCECSPTLLLVKTHRIRCAQCKAWFGRLPQWDNAEMGKGWGCDFCGCTSITIHTGRPFGPQSAHWKELEKKFHDSLHVWNEGDERAWFLSTVVVEPNACACAMVDEH